LDVCFELGYSYLADLTEWAHKEKPGSLIVGEIVNYPKDCTATGRANDSQHESIMKSWNVLDNHDIPRIISILPDETERKIAQVLQFTLPGSPNLYYRSELGMEGSGDPAVRAPMRWDLVRDENPNFILTKKLIQLHNNCRALKIGDYRQIHSAKLLAFERYTDLVEETIIVIVNTADEPITENILVPDSKLVNDTKMVDLMGQHAPIHMSAAFLKVNIPAKSFLILQPKTDAIEGYSPYKRIK
jgi:cyclomaltodextrinase / maltogenic alpha-amylase / neopullulanase